MSAGKVIRNYLAGMRLNQMVTPLNFLNNGWTTNSVYQALHRLVKAGALRRVARGVYLLANSEQPTDREIEKVKAERFGRLTSDDPEDIAVEMKLLERTETQSIPALAINGHNSKFHIIEIDQETMRPINFHGLSNRKVRLGQTKVGRAILALWKVGKKRCDESHVELVLSQLNAHEAGEFYRAKRLMPGWLADFFETEFDLLESIPRVDPRPLMRAAMHQPKVFNPALDKIDATIHSHFYSGYPSIGGIS